MGTPRGAAGWTERATGAAQELRQWRSSHPRASFEAIEDAVDTRLDRLRAELIEELAHEVEAEAAPVCPECGGPARRRGMRTRTVLVQGDHAVRLERTYAVCRACRIGFFPPG